MMLRTRLLNSMLHSRRPAATFLTPKYSIGQIFGPMRFFSSTGSDMVTFKIIDEHDDEHTVEGKIGHNMMDAGLHAKVPFLVACGGNAECCTCHCFFPKDVIMGQDYEEPGERELDALDFADGADENSRLACQVNITKSFDGHTFRMLAMD